MFMFTQTEAVANSFLDWVKFEPGLGHWEYRNDMPTQIFREVPPPRPPRDHSLITWVTRDYCH